MKNSQIEWSTEEEVGEELDHPLHSYLEEITIY